MDIKKGKQTTKRKAVAVKTVTIQDVREKYTLPQLIQALKLSGGMISVAAEKLSCSRQTIYSYLEKYPELREAKEDIEDKMLDLVEAKLISKINEGDMTGIIFYLKTKGKRRGYIERTETIVANAEVVFPRIRIEDSTK